MSDAQIGLLVATPVIIGFSIALNRMGVLQRYSATIAVVASCLIAAVLFFQQ
jgi:nitrate/nitrite transporter NarK